MSQPRIIRETTSSYYHAYTRIVDKVKRIGDIEKRFLYHWMRRLERFSGVEVVTYCLMSNHFHLLLRVPQKDLQQGLDAKTLRSLLPFVYRDRQLACAYQELESACASAAEGSRFRLDQILARYDARRFDLSSFMKDLKQKFTQWYNGKNDRVGTLWEDKFHSVLVEGSEEMLLTIAAYIDLNPIRAGLVSDPKDYRWSGYGEAVAGKSAARRGLCTLLEHTSFATSRRITWANVGPRYRTLLYGHGERRDAGQQTGSAARSGFDQDQVAEVLRNGGELSIAQILRCRVRYFTCGGVLGSGDFVNEIYDNFTHGAPSKNASSLRSANRKTGARKMQGADWGELRTLRDLRKDVFEIGE